MAGGGGGLAVAEGAQLRPRGVLGEVAHLPVICRVSGQPAPAGDDLRVMVRLLHGVPRAPVVRGREGDVRGEAGGGEGGGQQLGGGGAVRVGQLGGCMVRGPASHFGGICGREAGARSEVGTVIIGLVALAAVRLQAFGGTVGLPVVADQGGVIVGGL